MTNINQHQIQFLRELYPHSYPATDSQLYEDLSEEFNHKEFNLPPAFMMAACGPLNQIGYQNKLPWPYFRNDMLDFTRLTANRILVMGYNTFKSLPSNFRIGNRKILVVTNNLGGYGLPHWTSWKPVYQKIQPLTLPKTAYTNDISLVGIDSLKLNYVICGGLQLFNHHLGKLPLRLTKILKGEFKADTYFPEFKHLNHQSCSKFHYDSNIDFYKISWVNFL